MPCPEAGLFLRPWIYAFGLLDEYAVAAYWLGRDADCAVACAIVLGRPGLDAETRTRVARNRDFAHDRLAACASPWLRALGPDRAPRIAVVTPYHREDRATLERAVASVRRQTVPADHVVVCDGPPQDWLDGAVARHVRLDRPCADAGNTPRAIGTMLAASDGYLAICLLDADCWFDDDHVEACLVAALAVGLDRCSIVVAGRRFRRPDLTTMPLPDEAPAAFVDTNCYLFLPPSFGILPAWGLVPKAIDWIGDRLFHKLALARGHLSTGVSRATVNYVTRYAPAYRALGEAPPGDAKEMPDHAGFRRWIAGLPEAALATLARQIGIDLRALYPDMLPGASGPSSPDSPPDDSSASK